MKKLKIIVVSLLLMSILTPSSMSLAATVNSKEKAVVTDQVVKPVKDIILKEINLPTGVKWQAKDSFENIVLPDGKKLVWDQVMKDIKVTGEVKHDVPGKYKVTYQYGNKKKDTFVTVKDMEVTKVQQVLVKNTTIMVGEKWTAKDNFDSALLTNGIKVTWDTIGKDIVTVGEVNTNKAGAYKVTYTYKGVEAIATITVVEKAVVTVKEVSVKDTTLAFGSKWTAKDNFNYVLLSDGTQLTWDAVEKEMLVAGQVNTTKAGVYKVEYTYKGVSIVANVTVQEKAPATVKEVSVKNTTIAFGSKWTAKDNFNYILLSDGTQLTWDAVQKEMLVAGQVNTTKAGTYKVEYTYKGVSGVANITVQEKAPATVKEVSVKNTTLAFGSKWTAKDNFNYVLLSDGTKLTWEQVQKGMVTTGQVDPNKAGVYKVTYTYQGVSNVATITINAKAPAAVKELSIKNTTINLGTKWTAKDNFNYVLLADGTKLTWEQVQKEMLIAGTVDTNKVGVYKVTYTYKGVKVTATINVINPTKPKTLPQTGETENIAYVVIGLTVLLVTLAVVIIKKKKDVA